MLLLPNKHHTVIYNMNKLTVQPTLIISLFRIVISTLIWSEFSILWNGYIKWVIPVTAVWIKVNTSGINILLFYKTATSFSRSSFVFHILHMTLSKNNVFSCFKNFKRHSHLNSKIYNHILYIVLSLYQ